MTALLASSMLEEPSRFGGLGTISITQGNLEKNPILQVSKEVFSPEVQNRRAGERSNVRRNQRPNFSADPNLTAVQGGSQ